eukprot:CAMPEP_0177590070 /NCGR_PEP_ID=MMETSP0419_2-20121207/7178_1 /TAXON_ID=582737 /ORGANISM="Tetraselmis sp., Strain GSL018" /LENGTH=161 /DNA_ID=CAMNT_0019080541 /DNA_START=543 /DNA_END=1028 /DNA_ORIENTATION=+
MVGEERVLELDVAVHNPLVVHVIYGADQLLKEPPGLVFLQAAAADDKVEEVTAGRKLHRDANVLRGEEDLLKLDDVGVVEAPVVVDLALHVLADFVPTLYELDSKLLPSVSPPCQLNKPKAPAVEVPDLLIFRVVFQWVIFWGSHSSCVAERHSAGSHQVV